MPSPGHLPTIPMRSMIEAGIEVGIEAGIETVIQIVIETVLALIDFAMDKHCVA